MKRILLIVAAAVLAGLLCLAWGWRQWTAPGSRAGRAAATVRVRIPQGMTLATAADTLVARGVLEHRWLLLAGARLTGRDRSLQAGLYQFVCGQAPRDLLADLAAGRSVLTVLTVPEGLEAAEMAERVGAALGFSPDRFLALADSLARREALRRGLFGPDAAVAAHDTVLAAASVLAGGRAFHWCEGMLAPDTYHFAEGSDAQTVAAYLLATQLERLAGAVAAGQGAMNEGLTPMELLTFASVVESEARRDDERPLIAAVYANRLQSGRRLEADPTVAYVLGRKGTRLFYRDLKVDSPYNTYRRLGLPPGPIGTPGAASLAAAAQPDSACEALFFVSDGKDGHIFSRTARDHEAAVKRFRALRGRDRSAGPEGQDTVPGRDSTSVPPID
jgi:UPF0755 protein